MKFIVSQGFETLGDPSRTEHPTAEGAAAAAAQLVADLTEMVSQMETPADFDPYEAGTTEELKAWEEAAELCGLEFDLSGERTPSSPKTFGPAAGAHIAKRAVSIEQSND